MPTLYGAFQSRATRPLWLLFEAGTTFDHVPVAPGHHLADPLAADAPPNTKQPEFRRLNPLGQVPVLTDGDLVMTESLAITWYLARRYGGDLGPRDLVEEGQMLQWGMHAAGTVEAPALQIMLEHRSGDATSPEAQARIAAAMATLAPPLGRLDTHLHGREWLVGDRFTVADIMLAECIRYATAQPGALDPWPALRGWLARCHDRPAFKRMWAARVAEGG